MFSIGLIIKGMILIILVYFYTYERFIIYLFIDFSRYAFLSIEWKVEYLKKLHYRLFKHHR